MLIFFPLFLMWGITFVLYWILSVWDTQWCLHKKGKKDLWKDQFLRGMNNSIDWNTEHIVKTIWKASTRVSLREPLTQYHKVIHETEYELCFQPAFTPLSHPFILKPTFLPNQLSSCCDWQPVYRKSCRESYIITFWWRILDKHLKKKKNSLRGVA